MPFFLATKFPTVSLLYLFLHWVQKCLFSLTTNTNLSFLRSSAPCRQFAEACGQALDVNERLIKEDQLEYQEEMRAHYRDLLSELSAVMNEQVPPQFP